MRTIIFKLIINKIFEAFKSEKILFNPQIKQWFMIIWIHIMDGVLNCKIAYLQKRSFYHFIKTNSTFCNY